MKDWWRKWLHERIVASAAGAEWLDSLPKPARDELIHTLLCEINLGVDVTAVRLNGLAGRYAFPDQDHGPASSILYLKGSAP